MWQVMDGLYKINLIGLSWTRITTAITGNNCLQDLIVFIAFLFNCSINFECLLFNAAPEVVEKPGDTSLAKLKSLYTQAKELSESEVRYMYINL